MAKGDGSIIEKARGVWEVQVPLGKDPITGKYRKKSRTVRGTKADARKVRDQIRRELEGGLRPDGDKVRFLEFVATFSQARRNAGKASEDRIAKDEKSLRLCGELLGDPPLCKVDHRGPVPRHTRAARGPGVPMREQHPSRLPRAVEVVLPEGR